MYLSCLPTMMMTCFVKYFYSTNKLNCEINKKKPENISDGGYRTSMYGSKKKPQGVERKYFSIQSYKRNIYIDFFGKITQKKSCVSFSSNEFIKHPFPSLLITSMFRSRGTTWNSIVSRKSVPVRRTYLGSELGKLTWKIEKTVLWKSP